MNLPLSLDADGYHFFEDDVAHTRGKTLIPVLWWEGDAPTTSIHLCKRYGFDTVCLVNGV